ncbi:MAG: uracil-DNA glycosylase [Campylobacterota bacterium]|nr:uracil-DNA glycosylase [Campylobacterota bacterium]
MNWNTLIQHEQQKSYFKHLQSNLNDRYATTVVYPPKELIFNAFDLCPYDKLKIVILGQDPYHGAGQAQGLAFSTPKQIKNPPSMVNIFKEIHSDLGTESSCSDGDLTSWAQQGVLLINAILTVEHAKAKSHHKLGWERFSNNVIQHISENFDDIIFILWGNPAIEKTKLIDQSKHHILSAPHPSPLSSYRGFFGCKHFSKSNEMLIETEKEPINW